MLLQLLVELQGDADHHFGLVPVGVGDVVQDAIEIWSSGRGENVHVLLFNVNFDSYWQSSTNINQSDFSSSLKLKAFRALKGFKT